MAPEGATVELKDGYYWTNAADDEMQIVKVQTVGQHQTVFFFGTDMEGDPTVYDDPKIVWIGPLSAPSHYQGRFDQAMVESLLIERPTVEAKELGRRILEQWQKDPALAIGVPFLRMVSDIIREATRIFKAHDEVTAGWKGEATISLAKWHDLGDRLMPYAELSPGDDIPTRLAEVIPKLIDALRFQPPPTTT